MVHYFDDNMEDGNAKILFDCLDTDGSGSISAFEFMTSLDPRIAQDITNLEKSANANSI